MGISGNPLLVAIDDGYAQTKLWGERPDGTTASFMMRSSARPGRYALMSISGDGFSGTYRTDEGEEFTVSEDIEGENTQFDGFHTSTMNRVLVHHALSRGNYGGREVHLVSGLPVGEFFRQGRRNDAAIEAKKSNLIKKIQPATEDQALAVIARVDIGCQAMAAFVDYWIDDDMKERDVPVEKIAVVDIGGRTTDIVLVLDGASFDPRRSGTENIGALDVYNTLADMIRGEFRTRDVYPIALLDQAVRQRTIRLWGRQRDIGDMVDLAIAEQKTKIIREIERRLGTASDIDTVLFVGGGAAMFRGINEIFPNGQTTETPEWSNARGLFKYIKYFSKAENDA